MFVSPKNRRKPSEARRRVPVINWRYLGLWMGALAAIAAAVSAVSWAFDQPIETVAVRGRFQRVAPVDVERVVKERVHGAGLLSVDLAAVRRSIHTLPWVYAVSVQRAWPRGLDVLVIEPGSHRARLLRRLTTDSLGHWALRTSYRNGRRWRVSWRSPAGTVFSGPPIRAY